jgi:demethylmenaquinone methyltransferase/2-methoxy-6-polyprenyl-1,4-benzoquinol methylase
MDAFLRAFHGRLEPGAAVFMFDERASEERRTPPSRVDDAGNRYEMRRLADGEQRFEIVKNLLDRDELARRLAPHAIELVHRELRCFWVLEYRVG